MIHVAVGLCLVTLLPAALLPTEAAAQASALGTPQLLPEVATEPAEGPLTRASDVDFSESIGLNAAAAGLGVTGTSTLGLGLGAIISSCFEAGNDECVGWVVFTFAGAAFQVAGFVTLTIAIVVHVLTRTRAAKLRALETVRATGSGFSIAF